MRIKTLYLIILFIAAAVVVLFITSSQMKRKLDERVTLRRQDKIPYGTNVAYRSLPLLFPGARILVNRTAPGEWDSISSEDAHQAFISITDFFNADEYEMNKLISFAGSGNDVFISAKGISTEVLKMLISSSHKMYNTRYPTTYQEYDDSLRISLMQPQFAVYTYPGLNFSSTFNELNMETTDILGKDEGGHPNFIHLRAGSGNLYIHKAPLAFSNYFLLHKNNIRYFESALSVLAPGVNKIIWDEYYQRKRSEDRPKQKKKNWVSVLFRYPGLGAGLLTAMLGLLVYVLFEMRRKQRIIPVISRPRNDSMDFVKTIGRLYYEKGDHKNLGKKMTAFFLEYVRSKYKLSTGTLDEVFLRNLQYKTGMEESELRNLITTIKYIDDSPAVSSGELTGFHRQLESFYKKA